MSLETGSHLGDYEIAGHLGRGGMGEVYRAIDTRLGREVAIKVLPDDVAADAERVARFEREARVLASLNHPNIATLHGFEQDGALHFLVMELAPGEDLAQQLSRGPLELRQALEVFLQIAEGLEAAHRRGVVHRDLKPANVKVSSEGRVKILDFGLAKALTPEEGVDTDVMVENSHSPTLTLAATRRGILLGTAAYMSPEQARGEEVDRQTDVWAFGCCLLESVSGEPVFADGTSADTIARVLTREPDWDRYSSSLPPRLIRLLRHCLAKKPGDRLRDLGDAALEIRGLIGAGSERRSFDRIGASRERRRPSGATIAALALAALLGLLVGWALPDGAPVDRATPIRRFQDRLSAMSAPVHSLAVSPQGRVVVVASTNAREPLRVRRLDGVGLRPLHGSEGGEFPFFSPDGDTLGYFVRGAQALVVLPLAGGQPTILTDGLVRNWGASWGDDDRIVYHSLAAGEGLSRIPARGGDAEVLTSADAERGEHSHRWPQVLPGARGVVFTLWKGSADVSEIAFLDLVTLEVSTLGKGTFARYLPNGHLVYFDESRMMAARFDPEMGRFTGPPVRLTGYEASGRWGHRTVAVSDNGLLVLAQPAPTRVVRIGAGGDSTPLDLPRATYLEPNISTDGQRLAVSAATGGGSFGIWVFELRGGEMTRVELTERGENSSPVFSNDGDQVFFWSERDGRRGLYRKKIEDSGAPLALSEREEGRPTEVSPDGRWIATSLSNDVWLVSTESGEREPLAVTEDAEGAGVFSPDGKWVAYMVGEDFIDGLVIRRRGDSGPGRRLKGSFGAMRWSADGSRIVGVRGSRNRVMSTAEFGSDGEIGPIEDLFPYTYLEGPTINWDVTPDGGFIVIEADEPPTLSFTDGWFEELARRLPDA